SVPPRLICAPLPAAAGALVAAGAAAAGADVGATTGLGVPAGGGGLVGAAAGAAGAGAQAASNEVPEIRTLATTSCRRVSLSRSGSDMRGWSFPVQRRGAAAGAAHSTSLGLRDDVDGRRPTCDAAHVVCHRFGAAARRAEGHAGHVWRQD